MFYTFDNPFVFRLHTVWEMFLLLTFIIEHTSLVSWLMTFLHCWFSMAFQIACLSKFKVAIVAFNYVLPAVKFWIIVSILLLSENAQIGQLPTILLLHKFSGRPLILPPKQILCLLKTMVKMNHFPHPYQYFIYTRLALLQTMRAGKSLPFGITPNRRFYSMLCQTIFLNSYRNEELVLAFFWLALR